ncbi:hypothetical protein ACSSV1_001913 [Labrenzia sp. MBR-25]|jgi:hypothetical protein
MTSHWRTSHETRKALNALAFSAVEQPIENQLLRGGCPHFATRPIRNAGDLVGLAPRRGSMAWGAGAEGFPRGGGRGTQEGERSHTDPIFCKWPHGTGSRVTGKFSVRPGGRGARV